MDSRFFVYNAVTMLALPPLLISLALGRKYRQGFVQRLGYISHDVHSTLKQDRPVWLHAVSVGEVIASIPIMKRIKRDYPDLRLVVSTVTATGNYTVLQKVPEADAIIYFPYDYYFIVNKVINTINPCIFIHTETEIWPNFLWALRARGIPSVIVNGRLSSRSSRGYHSFKWLFREVFDQVSAFGMQSQIDCERVIAMGVNPDKVLLTGNMKFDQNISDALASNHREMLAGLHLSNDTRIFIAGSTHSGEEEIVLNVYEKLVADAKGLVLILAPRHPERFQEVEKMIRKRGLIVARKTAIGKNQNSATPPQVILLDTIGELSRIYGIADVVFVGGSLVDIGGHNILEPVVHRKPVIFGPHMQNFPEITATLRKSGAGILVNSEEELLAYARTFLEDREKAQAIGEKGFQVIQLHQGATERNMELINRFIRRQGEGFKKA